MEREKEGKTEEMKYLPFKSQIICNRHGSVLQCVALCCSILQYIAVQCSVLQCVAAATRFAFYLQCSVLQCVAVCCSVLQRVAACCSVIQCNVE